MQAEGRRFDPDQLHQHRRENQAASISGEPNREQRLRSAPIFAIAAFVDN